ncbi:MAG: rRNA pseudouridine synthase [Chloroflexi bacterium]|nr:rRNA pseudouridine synthase [Chloroflexota bacterium]
MEERLQKLIAHAGIVSRRAAEDLITAGAVTVNGQVAHLGQKADPAKDDIRVEGKPLPKQEPARYYIVYKPRGVLSAAQPQPQHPDLPVVTELVKSNLRLYPVGRLDLNSEGLVLLTNDGQLANQLTHPRYGHKKTYKVQVEGNINEEKLNRWRSGMQLPDGFRTSPCSVKVLNYGRDSTWLRVSISEGHKRQIRSIAELLGHPVWRLIRTHIGPLEIGELPPGQSRELSNKEVEVLKQELAKQQQIRAKSKKRKKRG